MSNISYHLSPFWELNEQIKSAFTRNICKENQFWRNYYGYHN